MWEGELTMGTSPTIDNLLQTDKTPNFRLLSTKANLALPVALLICIRKVTGSIPGRETDYPEG
jgi:hypothetical protein